LAFFGPSSNDPFDPPIQHLHDESNEADQAFIENHVSIFMLVGGLELVFFSIIYGIILPIDELIFFKMVIAPPTSYVVLFFQIRWRDCSFGAV
jgi:hypothetical protein